MGPGAALVHICDPCVSALLAHEGDRYTMMYSRRLDGGPIFAP
jgi:hypothetical protein